MSQNYTEEEYHLTRSGWVYGQEKGQRRPDDSVETWIRFKEQAIGWTEEHVSWTLSWYDETVSEQDRIALRRRFKDPTVDFPGS